MLDVTLCPEMPWYNCGRTNDRIQMLQVARLNFLVGSQETRANMSCYILTL